MHDVIVIGGGLTGLIAFRHLAAELDVLLLEARPRVLASAGVSCFWVFLGIWEDTKKRSKWSQIRQEGGFSSMMYHLYNSI